MKELTLKDHRKNQKFNIIHEFFWGFGTAFHTIYAVVPIFLKKLGAPEAIAVSSTGIFSILIAKIISLNFLSQDIPFRSMRIQSFL